MFSSGYDIIRFGDETIMIAPDLIGYNGLTRMRTDGSIRVVDYLHEVETDRETKHPSYETTTDIP